MDVLYFDSSKTLQAYDEITLGGTGQSNVTIDRHLASQEPAAPPLAPAPVVSTTP
jgi:hypothetical protein